jgi:ubiquinone/menaquinone biosynthesis C-methylase UbiE
MTMKEIEKYWKDSFDSSALNDKDDHKIAQWSEHGLKRRIKYFRKIFYKTVPDSKDKIILDAGCGSGIYSMMVSNAGWKVISADYSLNMIKVTREKHAKTKNNSDLNLIVSDLNALPIKDNAINYVICFGVLQHLYDAELAIKEFARALPAGGTLLINAPNKRFLLKRTQKLYNWYIPRTVGTVAIRNGFSTYNYDNLFIFPKILRWAESIFDLGILNKAFPWMAHDFIILLKK